MGTESFTDSAKLSHVGKVSHIDRYTYIFKTIVGPEKRQGWISYRYGSEAKYLQFDCHKEVNKQVDRERHKIF